MNLISVRKKLNGHKDKFYLYDSLLTIKKIGGGAYIADTVIFDLLFWILWLVTAMEGVITTSHVPRY